MPVRGMNKARNLGFAASALVILTALTSSGTPLALVIWTGLLLVAPSVLSRYTGTSPGSSRALALVCHLGFCAFGILSLNFLPIGVVVAAGPSGVGLALWLANPRREVDNSVPVRLARLLDRTALGGHLEDMVSIENDELGQAAMLITTAWSRFVFRDTSGVVVASLVLVVPTLGVGSRLLSLIVDGELPVQMAPLAVMHLITYPCALVAYVFAKSIGGRPRRLRVARSALILTVLAGNVIMLMTFADAWTWAEVIALTIAMVALPLVERGHVVARVASAASLTVCALTLLIPFPEYVGGGFATSYLVTAAAYLVGACSLTWGSAPWRTPAGPAVVVPEPVSPAEHLLLEALAA